MSEFEIEKGIPFRGYNKRNGAKYPFATMEVGDSFYVPASDTNSWAVSAAIQEAKKKLPGRRFASRKENDGRRVWRVE